MVSCTWLLSLGIMFKLVSSVSNHSQTKMNSATCYSVPLKKNTQKWSHIIYTGKLLLGSLWQWLVLLLQNPVVALCFQNGKDFHLKILSIFVEPALGCLLRAPCPLSDWVRLLGLIIPMTNEVAKLQPNPAPYFKVCHRGSYTPGLTFQDSNNSGKTLGLVPLLKEWLL